jgi:hypothetical protein
LDQWEKLIDHGECRIPKLAIRLRAIDDARRCRDRATERGEVSGLIADARLEEDSQLRLLCFKHAIDEARKSNFRELELEAVSFGVILSIGSRTYELVSLFWDYFSRFGVNLEALTSRRSSHLFLWAAERVLYYACEFNSVPQADLDAAMSEWIAGLQLVGGYQSCARLRLNMHQRLRMGHLDRAEHLMSALENDEPESDLVPSPQALPREVEQSSGGAASDFGCNAYANQIRVIYHCSRGDGRSAWRCARYLVEGRSACGVAVCAVAPREALAALLDPLIQAGMFEEAGIAHRMGLPMVTNVPEAVGWLGMHARYLAKVGDLDKATSCIQRFLGPNLNVSLDSGLKSATPFHRFHLYRGVSCVLIALKRAPLALIKLSKRGALKVDDRIEQSLQICRARAVDLAKLFDSRNGNGCFLDMLSVDGLL